MPPLAKRVWNFTVAIAKHVRDGAVLVTAEEQAGRLAICQACPLLKDEVCTSPACGCVIDGGRTKYWNKLAWRSETCPEGKWPDISSG